VSLLEAEPILSLYTYHQNATLLVDGSKINEPNKNSMAIDMCRARPLSFSWADTDVFHFSLPITDVDTDSSVLLK